MSIVDSLPKDVCAVIDGEPVTAAGRPRHAAMDPSTGAEIFNWAEPEPATIGRLIDRSAAAAVSWATTTPRQRSTLLLRYAGDLEDHGEDLARLDAQNVGMPLAYARMTVEAAIDTFRFFAGAARSSSTPSAGDFTASDVSMVQRTPLGIVAAFTPWNVPTLMTAWKLAPALATGNSVILKPSELTPLSALLLARLAGERLPRGVLTVALGTPSSTGIPLMDDERVRMVTLTGGTEAGRAVAERAARTVKRVHLELGGKGLAVVLADADLDRAAQVLARGGLDNSGQDCTAASRIIVDARVHDDFLDAFTSQVDRFKIGRAFDESTDLGPVISRPHQHRLLAAVDAARGRGQVHASPAPVPDTGYFVKPTVISELPDGDPLKYTELFGPVMTVESFGSMAGLDDELGKLTHRLGASIWTGSGSTAMALAQRLPAGKIWINNHHVDALEMPHSGSWYSGDGIEQSILALNEYQTLKTVYIWKDTP